MIKSNEILDKELIEVCQKYLDKYGKTLQVITAMEELGELISALSRHFFRERLSKSDLASEIADVEIVCQSLRLMIGNDFVDVWKVEKIKRMIKRLNIEKMVTGK